MTDNVTVKLNELMSKLDKEKITRTSNAIITDSQKIFAKHTKNFSKDAKDAVVLQMFLCGNTESEADNGT